MKKGPLLRSFLQRGRVQRHAGWPKRTTFGKEKGGKKTKLVQKAAFPSLPSPYVFPLWTLFSLSLSYPSLCHLLTWGAEPFGSALWPFLFLARTYFHRCRMRKQSKSYPVRERAEQATAWPGPAFGWRRTLRVCLAALFQIRPRRGHHNSEFRIPNYEFRIMNLAFEKFSEKFFQKPLDKSNFIVYNLIELNRKNNDNQEVSQYENL